MENDPKQKQINDTLKYIERLKKEIKEIEIERDASQAQYPDMDVSTWRNDLIKNFEAGISLCQKHVEMLTR